MGGISVLFLMGLLSFIYIFVITFIAIITFYTLISYIFESISIVSMSKNQKYKNTNTGWIPFYNKYILSKIGNSKPLGITLFITTLISTITIILFFVFKEPQPVLIIIFLLSTLITFILDIILSHKIFNKYSKNFKDVMTALSILSLGFLRPIFLFIIRNKKENIWVNMNHYGII